MTAPIDTAELRQLLSNPGKGSWVSAVLEKQSTADAIVAVVNAAPAMLDELDALRADLANARFERDNKTEAWHRACDHVDALRAENANLHDAHLGQMQRANDLFVECERLRASNEGYPGIVVDLQNLGNECQRLQTDNERLRAELRIKSEFLSSRQCPDHNGKWPRGTCLQCEVERLRAALEQICRRAEIRQTDLAPFEAEQSTVRDMEKLARAALEQKP